MTENGTAKELGYLLKARYSVIYVVSPEEGRVESAIAGVAKAQNRECFAWSIARGLIDSQGTETGPTDPLQILDTIRRKSARAVYILRDFHAFFDDVQVRRAVRDLASDLRQRKAGEEASIVILSPDLKLPKDLEKDVAVLDWPMPSRENIGELLDTVLAHVPESKRAGLVDNRAAVVDAATGLTMIEAENAFARAIVADGKIEPKAVVNAKRDAIRKSGALEFYPAGMGLEDIAGLDVLKAWIAQRRRAFSPEARKFGIDVPKGALLIGPPGTGKSLSAKVIAGALGYPLVRLDVGRLLGSLVGESEANWQSAKKVIESVAPCVLWIDEIEKALSTSAMDTVMRRLVASLLTWTVDKTAPVYIVATANDVTALPPELLRKGRFDEMWIVDLPNASEREAILKLHLAKRGRKGLDVSKAASASQGFSGAELEAAVVDALTRAFDSEREVTAGDIEAAIADTAPLSVTFSDRIDALRQWAKGRARFASKPAVEAVTPGPGRFAGLTEGR